MFAARIRVLFSFVLLAIPASAPAQTADPLFAGLRWAPQPPGSRPAGIGGAFAAVADGGKAAYFNPAGLAQLPLKEFELSFADPWLSLGARLGVLRFAAYGTKAAPDARGSLDTSFSEVGFGIGVAPMHNVKLGVAGAWSRFELEGQRTVTGAGGQQTLLAGVRGDNGRFRVTAGALVTLFASEIRGLPMMRLGVSYQPGFDWSAEMMEASAAGPVRRTIDVRRPSVLTAGLAWYGSDRWSFFAQGDVIRYGEVLGSLRRNVGSAARDFDMNDAIEPRGGSEFAFPLSCGCGTVKLRAGLQYLSPGTLVYSGTDPVLEQAFGVRSWRAVASLGASFFAEYFGRALRLDLDSKDLLEGPALSFGLVWRF